MATRRSFMRRAAAGSAALAALQLGAVTARAYRANEKLRVGLIGCGGRGSGLGAAFAELKDAEVVWVCDPDEKRLGKSRTALSAAHAASDFRKLLDDKTLDAVIVATPDHWHAPAAIMACDAGKHVYVEKPCSHNLREGRLLVEAARRNKSIVQHGTQSRSMPLIADAMEMLREGAIGDVLVARAWNVQKRGNIGRMKPSPAPAGVDYDAWVGPAEMVPYQENRFHYAWHWWFNFGTGDAGNDGAHELDVARWGLGVETHPARIVSSGGKYFFDDDQEFPDTQTAVFEYPGNGLPGGKRQLIWEMRLWSTNYPYNVDNGVEFIGTKGKMFVSKRGKFELLGERNAKLESPKLQGKSSLAVPHHQQDFVDAVKNGRAPNAEIAIGHLSASLCHLANVAARTSRSLQFDPATERFLQDESANQLLGRTYRAGGHWSIPKGATT